LTNLPLAITTLCKLLIHGYVFYDEFKISA